MILQPKFSPYLLFGRKCAGKSRGGNPKESRPNEVESAGVLTQFNALVLQHEDMIKKNKELAGQIESLSSQNRGFSTQKKDLITQKKALSAKNKSLLSQTKDLTLKNDELGRQVRTEAFTPYPSTLRWDSSRREQRVDQRTWRR